MTDAYTIQPEFTRSRSGRNRAVSRQNSPIPRQQLGVLNVNQRSYSRAGRKSAGEDGYGDDSFQLMSPLPFYPHRRSVTFADGSETEKSGVREERPHYNTTLTASASQPSMSAGVSPTRRGESPVASPPPTSILKNSSAYSEDDVASPHVRPPSGQAAAMSPRGSPVPLRRGRSASRQRLRARRHEAQLHHSFYEDSFVEEFVLGAKEDWERQQTEQRQAEKEKQQKKQESAATEEKEEHLTALQQAKEILLAAFQKRHRLGSPTPSPSRATTIHDGTEQQIATELPPRESVHSEKTKRTEANLLESLEEDSNPEVQEALAELSRLSAAAVASQTRSTAAARKRRCSMPIVAPEEEDDVEGSEPARQRSRVERLVAQLLERHERQPSKRSVVVINWEKEEEETRPSDELVEFTVRGAAQGGKRRAVTAATSSAPRRRTVSRAASAVPDLGDDSLLMRVVGEDDAAPILLPRRRPTRPAPTRSLSHLERDVDDVLFHESAEEEVVDVSRRPPRRAPAPRRRAAPKNSARVAKATPASRSRVEEENDMDDYDNYGEDESLNISSIPQTTTLNSTSSRNYATVSHTNSAPAPRRRRHVDVNASPVDRSDPMAVFFDAAFPSPSKFDDMLLQSGGMPEARRGHGRNQPNLVLPATIGRRRV